MPTGLAVPQLRERLSGDVNSWLEWIARRLELDYQGMRPDDKLYTRRSALKLVEDHGFEVRSVHLADMLPLTLPGELAARFAGATWRLNRVLARVYLLNLLATNVELIATRR